jgi:hypothetical protein
MVKLVKTDEVSINKVMLKDVVCVKLRKYFIGF